MGSDIKEPQLAMMPLSQIIISEIIHFIFEATNMWSQGCKASLCYFTKTYHTIPYLAVFCYGTLTQNCYILSTNIVLLINYTHTLVFECYLNVLSGDICEAAGFTKQTEIQLIGSWGQTRTWLFNHQHEPTSFKYLIAIHYSIIIITSSGSIVVFIAVRIIYYWYIAFIIFLEIHIFLFQK